ncbi:hypothetical protein NPX13_g871 [Xylaria arbuscula]|uniref:DUF7730 domain-containing protein n=1 Tax=Xylaria arbuscula TaxID=114810 RepID=A0A9W8TQP8_9PEZI|nr:hypothetical protein NPX13_g871 [Xylaria arbuscula]
MSPLLRFWKRDRHTHHNHQTQSLLFNLPAELRLQIFDIALNCSSVWLIVRVDLDGPHLRLLKGGVGIIPPAAPMVASRLTSLLLSCARAYDEALPVLYGLNTFCVCDLGSLRSLARGVGAPYITRLEVMIKSLFHLPLGPSQNSLTRWNRWLGKKCLREREWARKWGTIKRFERLQHLFIELEAPGAIWQETFRPFELMIIKPLEGLLKDGTTGKLRLFWDRPVGHAIAAEEVLNNWVTERVDKDPEFRRAVIALQSRT